MRVSFTSNDGDEHGDERGAYTEGMSELDPTQAELGVPIAWLPDERRDAQVEALLTFLHDYVAKHGKPIRANQLLRYGWTFLRTDPHVEQFRDAELLVLQELAHPFGEGDPAFVDGVAQAIRLLAIQQDAIHRCQTIGTADHPHRGDTALVCKRIARAGGTPLTLARLTLTNREFHDSGWVVACQERGHNHDDPAQLDGIHLWRLVAAYPWIFPYLAMPIGTRISREGDTVIVFRPDERRGQPDEARLFTLPTNHFPHP